MNSSADTDWYAAGKVGPAVKGSVGVELVDIDGLLVKEGDYKLVKTRFSAFFATHLHSLLQGAGINNLIIYHWFVNLRIWRFKLFIDSAACMLSLYLQLLV